MSYTRAAREAPPEHARAAGVLDGAVKINERLRQILVHLRKGRPEKFNPPVQTDLEVLTMLRDAQAQQTRSVALLEAIDRELGR